jgi:N-carbamoylputrescine amidase
VNRAGEEAGLKFWGGSFFSNPFGTVLYQSPHDQEDIAVEELDLDKSDYYRSHWPFLRDRRIDSYQPITKRLLDEEN